jgi:hypothetical protein
MTSEGSIPSSRTTNFIMREWRMDTQSYKSEVIHNNLSIAALALSRCVVKLAENIGSNPIGLAIKIIL